MLVFFQSPRVKQFRNETRLEWGQTRRHGNFILEQFQGPLFCFVIAVIAWLTLARILLEQI
jgi:hypothetical protein